VAQQTVALWFSDTSNTSNGKACNPPKKQPKPRDKRVKVGTAEHALQLAIPDGTNTYWKHGEKVRLFERGAPESNRHDYLI
jgi:hypothetical protein